MDTYPTKSTAKMSFILLDVVPLDGSVLEIAHPAKMYCNQASIATLPMSKRYG